MELVAQVFLLPLAKESREGGAQSGKGLEKEFALPFKRHFSFWLEQLRR